MSFLQAAMLAGLFALAALYTVKYTRPLLLPIVLAVLLNFLLHPPVRLLKRRWSVPYPVSSTVLLTVFLIFVISTSLVLSNPALDWVERAPANLNLIRQRVADLSSSSDDVQRLMERLEKLAGMEGSEPEAMPVSVRGPGLESQLLTYSRSIGSGALVTFVLLFFLLASGDTFLRKLIYILPRMRDKRQAVLVVNQVQRSISRYLLTVTGINIVVGLATAFAIWIIGLSNPILWGALAFAVNFIPYFGPIVLITVLVAAGLIHFESSVQALYPAAAFTAINFVEAYGITPFLVGRHLSLHPVAVLLSIVVWYFLWGVAGALIAVPLLVAFKILCDHVEPLWAVGEILSDKVGATPPPVPPATNA
jgi:predicted PurR-regulated permease PerM